MPTYQYAPDSGECLQCGGHFDQVQKLSEPALTQCPYCTRPVHREICGAALTGMSGPSADQITRAGFTQYKRAADGVYERKAGEGPEHLFAD